jgi:antitoxin PrlF
MPRSLTISSKGQITIPIEIRKRLGVKPGDRVEFVNDEGKEILRPVQPEESPFTKFIGCLPAFDSTEEVVAFWRDMRDPDGEYM